jgi:hypothetical protein
MVRGGGEYPVCRRSYLGELSNLLLEDTLASLLTSRLLSSGTPTTLYAEKYRSICLVIACLQRCMYVLVLCTASATCR